jgi:hypothetical protein
MLAAWPASREANRAIGAAVVDLAQALSDQNALINDIPAVEVYPRFRFTGDPEAEAREIAAADVEVRRANLVKILTDWEVSL